MQEPQLTTLHVVSCALDYLSEQAPHSAREQIAATLLANSGITLADLHSGEVRITRQQELTVCANGLASCPDLGLILGQRMHISAYGLLGYAAISCATLADALQLMFRYPALLGTYFQLQLHVEGELAWISASHYQQRADLLRFNIEMCLASLQQMCSDLVGRPLPIRAAEFTLPAPPYRNRYRDCFGDRLCFAAKRDGFAFDSQLLATPLPLANPVTHSEMVARCRQLDGEFNTNRHWLYRARTLLAGQLAHAPRLEQLAEQMHCSPRTLRRRLKGMGTSYQAQLDELRFEQAKQLLAEPSHAIYHIAKRLGFSESASFRHAFLRWSGVTPRQYRQY
ncbi:AraC family transcriptional regulator [Aeromonas cavernicola]|uniref:AraC family transcriptional regulator n=1 Tax=Aeromonas cavernicola TaxID=1006623 RepID=A0A2H9U1A1_9GAMM|nr:AraC family transcriptional regulator [Aeromonas cavernicola]PJG57783.1 AraC family transcriptional regulator [Aeromonas cavernicola]